MTSALFYSVFCDKAVKRQEWSIMFNYMYVKAKVQMSRIFKFQSNYMEKQA